MCIRDSRYPAIMVSWATARIRLETSDEALRSWQTGCPRENISLNSPRTREGSFRQSTRSTSLEVSLEAGLEVSLETRLEAGLEPAIHRLSPSSSAARPIAPVQLSLIHISEPT